MEVLRSRPRGDDRRPAACPTYRTDPGHIRRRRDVDAHYAAPPRARQTTRASHRAVLGVTEISCRSASHAQIGDVAMMSRVACYSPPPSATGSRRRIGEVFPRRRPPRRHKDCDRPGEGGRRDHRRADGAGGARVGRWSAGGRGAPFTTIRTGRRAMRVRRRSVQQGGAWKPASAERSTGRSRCSLRRRGLLLKPRTRSFQGTAQTRRRLDLPAQHFERRIRSHRKCGRASSRRADRVAQQQESADAPPPLAGVMSRNHRRARAA